MERFKCLLILCFIFMFWTTGCFNVDLAEQRERDAGRGNTILIGVPLPMEFAKENTKFINGLRLALNEINEEGINGKKIELDIRDDKGNFKEAVDIAQEFSENTNMLAVIGHWFSDICIPVSSIYEDAGMLTIVPTVSNPELTRHGYNYIFLNIASDNSIADSMAEFAQDSGYQRVVIYYEDSTYGRNFANTIENISHKHDIKVVDRRSGLTTSGQFKRAHDKWNALEYDAVLVALNMPEGADFIRQLRNINDEVGIITGDALDVGNFIEVLGGDAEGVVITTGYNPYHDTPELQKFTEKYKSEYNENPDLWAIQGYESLMLIAHALENTNSYSPDVLADYLRNMDPVQTTLGEVHFNEFSEITGRNNYQKVVVDGEFIYLE
ncbi:hypothetical protein SYNTR_1264 [Candidatus Syntrophocurvum alkaliphilum]|uniref:Leucine-binding protein domain-containing protein n=1 Tax=Candidatus Syntrophocurvum alkaliphilum TaxID=2293317 RepID=A0A6I6DFK5_9FIRM|nr:ABC transporter substrate-binding protein [Candidatus Syntrophocurvum alkaliphilum]QGT99857.1 hypothetical protein SYNTR_1264 [Candidatus Syntrophocurvum alkaliphilum]